MKNKLTISIVLTIAALALVFNYVKASGGMEYLNFLAGGTLTSTKYCTWNSTTLAVDCNSEGGTGTTINQLGQIGDVATSSPMTYGEVLRYNTATSKWESVATSTLGLPQFSDLFTQAIASTTFADKTLYVPYTGATTHLNLGLFNASTTQLTTTGSTYLATAGGNVGIGVTLPGSTLDVSGSIARHVQIGVMSNVSTIPAIGFAATLSSNNYSLGGDGSSFTQLNAPDGGLLYLGVGNLGKLMITSAGNVGIGTTSPWGKLSVTGTGQTTGVAFLVADSANAPKVTVLDNGNVGIGTTSPAGKLDVGTPTGVYRLTLSPVANFYGADVNAGQVALYSTDAATVGKGGSFSFGGENTVASGATSPYIFAQIKGAKEGATNTYNGYLSFSTTIGTSAITEKMRIDSSGNVGIGTTSPSAKLAITGTGQTTGRAFVIGDSANVERLTVLDNGNTTFSGGQLSLTGVTENSLNISGMTMWGGNTGGGLYARGNVTNGDDNFSISAYDKIKFIVVRGGVLEAMTIVPTTGNVGIGTTSPAVKLDINGYIKANQTSTTTACSDNLMGSIFYNESNNNFWGCGTGSAWTQLGGATGATGAQGPAGSAGVSTSTSPTIGQLAYWTTKNAWPELLGSAATTTLTEDSLSLSFSNPISVIGATPSVLSLATSTLYTFDGSGSCETGLVCTGGHTHDMANLTWENDWMLSYSNASGLVELPLNTGTGKFLYSNGSSAPTFEYAVKTATYPLQISTSVISVAYGTTTANIWGALNTFTNASSTLFSSSYASTTSLYVGDKKVLGTFDKSAYIASTTLDSTYKSFSTATSSFTLWNPSVAVGATSVYCQTDVGGVTIEVGNGTATTTAVCTTAGVAVNSTLTWSARAKVVFNIGNITTAANKVTITSQFYNQ
jgi:hypothetical protein